MINTKDIYELAANLIEKGHTIKWFATYLEPVQLKTKIRYDETLVSCNDGRATHFCLLGAVLRSANESDTELRHDATQAILEPLMTYCRGIHNTFPGEVNANLNAGTASKLLRTISDSL